MVALMLEEACEDLFEGALPVAESEAAVGWDRSQLAVGQLRDPAEGGAGGCELLDHGAEVDVVCRVVVVVLTGAQFLQEDLKLELSETKTLITHARTSAARFLG